MGLFLSKAITAGCGNLGFMGTGNIFSGKPAILTLITLGAARATEDALIILFG